MKYEQGDNFAMIKQKIIKCGKWKREFNFDFDAKVFFTITTEKYIIQITGGSVIILNRNSGHEINRLKGYNYLYTGDVKPDETELFTLENGKHFYIISLDDYTQKIRVTLPRSYEAIDVYGDFSENGESLFVPVHKFVSNKYQYWICEYETKSYSLVNMQQVEKSEVNCWGS